MSKPYLYLDYDSVLNNLDEAWINWLKLHYNINIDSKDIEHFNYVKETYGKHTSLFWQDPDI